MIKRILVPLDGSDLAESVLPYAEQIATKTGAEVLLLTSLYQVDSWAGRPVQADQEWVPLVRTYLESKGKELHAKGITAKTDIASGPAAEAILARVADENEDLVAMSSHGRSGIKRWVFGSVADKVLHGTYCPILMVRPTSASAKATNIPALDKILVPLDGSEHSLAVLPFIEVLAKALDASLVLVNVVPPITAYVGAEFIPPTGDFLGEQLAWAGQFLARIVKDVEGRGLKASQVVVVGLGVSEIVEVAHDAGADLIALSTHGRSGLARSLMGSVADGVVRRTELPCLVVRPPGAKTQA
jgi:nucleotide-binding universal stress UspA family protein